MLPPFDVTNDDDEDDDGADQHTPQRHCSRGERETDRDGFLSWSGEWHAVSHGLYLGFVTKPWRTPPEPRKASVKQESHYYRGAYVAGSLLQAVMLIAFAVLGIEHVFGIDLTGAVAEAPTAPYGVGGDAPPGDR